MQRGSNYEHEVSGTNWNEIKLPLAECSFLNQGPKHDSVKKLQGVPPDILIYTFPQKIDGMKFCGSLRIFTDWSKKYIDIKNDRHWNWLAFPQVPPPSSCKSSLRMFPLVEWKCIQIWPTWWYVNETVRCISIYLICL